MKQLAIFYRDRENQRAINYIESSFYSVLDDYILIENYYLDELSAGQIITADAYIVCYEEMLSHLVGHISDFSKVIVITRSIRQKYLRPILQIPPGTDVLVVNDSKESILQTLYMIYELGVGHIRLIPYEKDSHRQGIYDSIDYAIVAFDSEHLVPSHINNVYNIHNREISFETFHKLISVLDLKSASIHSNLLKKVSEELDTGANYINSYLSNFLKDKMLSNVVDESFRGIILLDSKSMIHYINDSAYQIFSLNKGDFFPEKELFSERLFSLPSFDNELISFKETNYLVEKVDISLMDQSLGCYLIFQNEKQLREQENNLSLSLKQTGFVAKHTFNDIIHDSASMRQCINISKKVASSDYTILIRGESGTGKELFAQSIHNYSSRKKYPFVAVNCAAIPENLLESELFGYEGGSFTGARRKGKVGLFEHANHGTIFLDEIGDISANLQTRLLRVIQEREIMPVGSDRIMHIDVRIIAATNADLEQKVALGKFRDDLFYRLNVISLNIAPLRERKEDILPLLRVFLGKKYNDLLPKEQKALTDHDWPGNVRELENTASYYKILGQLPDYLSDRFHCASAPCHDLSDSAADLDLNSEILKIMAESSGPYRGIGRKTLKERLSAAGLVIGEGTLKKHMQSLKERGLIESEPGRGGLRITAAGTDFIRRL